MAVSWPIQVKTETSLPLGTRLHRSSYPDGQMAVFVTDTWAKRYELSVNLPEEETKPEEFLTATLGEMRFYLEKYSKGGAISFVRRCADSTYEVWAINGLNDVWNIKDLTVVQEALRFLYINIDVADILQKHKEFVEKDLQRVYENTLGLLTSNAASPEKSLILIGIGLQYLLNRLADYRKCFWVAGVQGPQITRKMLESVLEKLRAHPGFHEEEEKLSDEDFLGEL